jgi:hypothetical protein
MLVVLEIKTLEAFLLGVPESIGLLAFGLGLTGAAVLLRWLLSRAEAAKNEKELDEELTR